MATQAPPGPTEKRTGEDAQADAEAATSGRIAPQRPSFLSEPAFMLWVVGMVGISLVFGLQSDYQTLIGPLSNIFPAAGALTAFLSAVLCWRKYGFGIRHQFELVWVLFSAGTALWVMAEVTWATYYFVLNTPVPYPSAADFFYVGGYIPLIIALGFYLRTFKVAMSRRRLAISALSVCAFVVLALGFILPSELSRGLTTVNELTDLAYPILDLALFSLTVFCLAIFLGGAISKWWLLFGTASLFYVIGDEYFLYQVATNVYYNGSIDDLFFILGYLTFALAFFAHRREF